MVVINDILRGYQHFLTNIMHQWIINQNSLSVYVTAIKDTDWDNVILPRENYVILGLIFFLYSYKFIIVIPSCYIRFMKSNLLLTLYLGLCFQRFSWITTFVDMAKSWKNTFIDLNIRQLNAIYVKFDTITGSLFLRFYYPKDLFVSLSDFWQFIRVSKNMCMYYAGSFSHQRFKTSLLHYLLIVWFMGSNFKYFQKGSSFS